MAEAPLSPVELLSEKHDLSAFDSGKESLDGWLRRWALVNLRNDSTRTFVVHRAGVVVGYYSLAAGSVRPEAATGRVAKGLAKHPIPVILLARLAADRREQGKGLGKAILKDALLRSLAAAGEIGARAVLVRALDERARGFYERVGFEKSPVDEFELMLLMKDLRAQLG